MVKEMMIVGALLARLGDYYDGDLDRKEVHCLAQNVYHEARGESISGQIAVAHVTLNRVKDERWPDTICGVVKQGYEKAPACQFSWWCDGKSDKVRDRKSFEQAVEIAAFTMIDWIEDNTRGAVFYYNPQKADPRWASSFTQVAEIENHLFLK